MSGLAEDFLRRIKRGRHFEGWERAFWDGDLNSLARFEAQTVHKGKEGRVDILLYDRDEGNAIVVELKATNWDDMEPHRVRPNALRHARQLWRYIHAELEDDWEALPALVYPRTPKTPGRKESVESALHDRLIQVVWRDNYPGVA